MQNNYGHPFFRCSLADDSALRKQFLINHLHFYHLTKSARADQKARKRQAINSIIDGVTEVPSKMAAIEDGQFPCLDTKSSFCTKSGLDTDFYCKEELIIDEPQVDNQIKITDLHAVPIVSRVDKSATIEVVDKGIQCQIEEEHNPASKKSKSLLYAKLFDTTEEKVDIMLEIYGSYDKIFEKLEHRLNK